MTEIKNIVLIGAGNVATHLGISLHEAGIHVVQVCNRSAESAYALGRKLGAESVSDFSAIHPNADLYIISVADDAISEVAARIPRNKFVVHTSGSQPQELLAEHTNDFGVFYPLQTFSKNRPVNFQTVPVCLEASNDYRQAQLNDLADKISAIVHVIPSHQRKVLHLAAVFACNFPNFMYAVAASILQASDLDFDLLKPLIRETAEKIQTVNPAEAQTGPALRGDTRVLEQHLEMLNNIPDYQALYRQISNGITKMNRQ